MQFNELLQIPKIELESLLLTFDLILAEPHFELGFVLLISQQSFVTLYFLKIVSEGLH